MNPFPPLRRLGNAVPLPPPNVLSTFRWRLCNVISRAGQLLFCIHFRFCLVAEWPSERFEKVQEGYRERLVCWRCRWNKPQWSLLKKTITTGRCSSEWRVLWTNIWQTLLWRPSSRSCLWCPMRCTVWPNKSPGGQGECSKTSRGERAWVSAWSRRFPPPAAPEPLIGSCPTHPQVDRWPTAIYFTLQQHLDILLMSLNGLSE